MANKSRPATMEEVNQLHNEWWDSLTNDQKEQLFKDRDASEREYYERS